MKKMDFLNKLYKQKKIQIIGQNEVLKASYTEKSESNLISAKILLQNNRLEESVSLAYYSMYHMITALLYKAGIKCENHTAAILILEEVFGVDNTDISYAKKERIDKQYYTNFSITKDEVTNTIFLAECFNKNLFDFISRLNSGDVNAFRKKFKEIAGIK